MENLENLKDGYEIMKNIYNSLTVKNERKIYSWLTLHSNVSVLEYRCRNTELYYEVQSLKDKVENRIKGLK